MDNLIVEPPPGAARWCAELAVSITKCFATLTKELRTESRDTTLSIQNIESKFDALSEKILRDVKETNTLAQEAYDIAKAAHDANNKLEQKVEILEKTVFIMGVKNKGLTQENNRLSRRCDDQETYSRRDNIVIRGVPEAADEDNAGCSHVARDFSEQNLNITQAHVEGMKFVRCHRLGKRLQHRSRPVIVRFQNFTDRELVWSRKTLLKNKAFSIHENFANEVEFRRRLLYPILDSRTKPPWTKPPGQNPPDNTPLDKTPRWTKPPRGQNPPGQNPPGQNPPDKTPPDKTPPDKAPRTKPPGQNPPGQNPPGTKLPGQNSLDKTPPDKTPRTKPPRTKPPRKKPPWTKPPRTNPPPGQNPPDKTPPDKTPPDKPPPPPHKTPCKTPRGQKPG